MNLKSKLLLILMTGMCISFLGEYSEYVWENMVLVN